MGDLEDREALVSLTRTCLNPRNMNWVQPHTPRYLLATLMPSPGKLQANVYAAVGTSARHCCPPTGVWLSAPIKKKRAGNVDSYRVRGRPTSSGLMG